MMNMDADRSAGFQTGSSRDIEDNDADEIIARPAKPAAPAPRSPAPPQPQQPAKANAKADAEAPKPKNGKRRVALAVVALAALGIGGYYGYQWWTVGRFLVSTDDAYVKADMSVIASKESGYIADVEITDNQHVRKGDLLAKIDDRDYKIAVQSAQNKLATQDATIARLKEQAKAQGALIEQSKAQVVSAQAGLTRAQADFGRAQDLANRDYGSKQTLDQARAERDQGQAAVASAQAAQTSTEAQLAVLNA